ncbi:Very-long-chain 3-oxoacyl-CoA reductase [Paramicrosporidium saccamoebae]|uniref:Very-long-chain 3-oxoacyl-CoA reductase n=1 Tax=Paramicrosporidium saccamoebae TaxID=1246581 RepID=A0A2H9TI84_9FUNG|nr:Very-long-chain 3-oxoacyl-CoA reductase [Paramicrosporidium saccamoebae]
MALETAVGPVCVTLRRGDVYAFVMVRTALGTDHLRIPMDQISRPHWYERLFRKWPSVEEVLRKAKHPLAAAPFIRVRDRSVGNSLIKLDERLVIGSHKIGVVYAGAGQSDLDQMLSNNTQLRGWHGFNGGLDTVYDHTGTTSYYTKWQQLEFMFHVGPLIPISHADPQYVSVEGGLTLFRDRAAPAVNLAKIYSRQIHGVLIVTPTSADSEFSFHLEIYRHKNMPHIPSFVEEPNVYSLSDPDHRSMFLAKSTLSISDTNIHHTIPSSRTVTEWSRYGAKKDSWAIVTGCTDGIGKEFALQLAKKGLNIILVARNAEKLKMTRDEILKDGGKCETHVLDFAGPANEAIEKFTATLKGKTVSVLVNNVGISHAHPEYFTETASETIEAIVTVNIMNTLLLTRSILPAMVQNNNGLILNLGSFAGEVPTPLLQTYAASKAFLKHWSKALAAEVGPQGVNVQLLNTYFVVSKLSRRKRASMMIPTPRDYVKAVLRSAGQSDFSTPYPSHAVLCALMELIPEAVLAKINLAQMRATRQIALQKAKLN